MTNLRIVLALLDNTKEIDTLETNGLYKVLGKDVVNLMMYLNDQNYERMNGV